MSQYKVILRDDSGVTPIYREDVVDFDGTKEELLKHSHIVEVLEEVKESKVKEAEDTKPKKK